MAATTVTTTTGRIIHTKGHVTLSRDVGSGEETEDESKNQTKIPEGELGWPTSGQVLHFGGISIGIDYVYVI